MHKSILLLTGILLFGSTVFASSNRPIYTIKDKDVHRSGGRNQGQCYQSKYYQ